MTNLVELQASSLSVLSNIGIKDINPQKIIICNNPNITNINHMTNLTELYASEYLPKEETKNMKLKIFLVPQMTDIHQQDNN